MTDETGACERCGHELSLHALKYTPATGLVCGICDEMSPVPDIEVLYE